jgi:hypothetical protein
VGTSATYVSKAIGLGRSHHHALIDLTDDEDVLAKEQEALDSHDDLVAELTVRVKEVIASSNESSRRIASRKLVHLQKSLVSITSIVCDASTTIYMSTPSVRGTDERYQQRSR